MRLDRETRTLLMTDVRQGGRYKVHDSHHNLIRAGIPIHNLEELKQQLPKVALHAFNGGEGVLLGSDAYSLLVDENGLGTIFLLYIIAASYRLFQRRKIFEEGVLAHYETTESDALERVNKFIRRSLRT